MLGLFLNTLAADEKYPFLNTDNLTIPNQMQIFQKHKTFSQFLLHFGNLDEILNILRKEMTLIGFVFSKFRTPKTWSDKCPKSSISEDPSTTTWLTCPSTGEICNTAHLSYSLITVKSIQFENVSLTDMPNLRTDCYHTGCR